MPVIEKSIEVNVPLRTAYNQWTHRFKEFIETRGRKAGSWRGQV